MGGGLGRALPRLGPTLLSLREGLGRLAVHTGGRRGLGAGFASAPGSACIWCDGDWPCRPMVIALENLRARVLSFLLALAPTPAAAFAGPQPALHEMVPLCHSRRHAGTHQRQAPLDAGGHLGDGSVARPWHAATVASTHPGPGRAEQPQLC